MTFRPMTFRLMTKPTLIALLLAAASLSIAGFASPAAAQSGASPAQSTAMAQGTEREARAARSAQRAARRDKKRAGTVSRREAASHTRAVVAPCPEGRLSSGECIPASLGRAARWSTVTNTQRKLNFWQPLGPPSEDRTANKQIDYFFFLRGPGSTAP
jgi:hypothetical protein